MEVFEISSNHNEPLSHDVTDNSLAEFKKDPSSRGKLLKGDTFSKVSRQSSNVNSRARSLQTSRMQARGSQQDKIKKMERALKQKDQMVSAMQGHTFHPQINRSRKVEKMVKHQLEDQAAAEMERAGDGLEKDILYNRVIVNMKRLLKVLTGHSNAIDSLERKLKAI